MAVNLEQVLQEALGLGEDGRWEEMAVLLRETLDSAPENPYLLGWLAVAEQELGNDGAAYDYFRECLAQDPADPHLLALAGSGLAAFDDPEAETALRAAALSAPDLPEARLHYGAYLARTGFHGEALEQLRAARDLAPEDAVVRGELGAALALAGERSLAIEELEETLALAPDDEWSRIILGLLHIEDGDFELGAEELIRGSIEAEDDPEAHVLAALAAAAVGWDDASYEALARAEQVATGADVAMAAEAEERITSGVEPARRMLVDTIGPPALRERLSQPL